MRFLLFVLLGFIVFLYGKKYFKGTENTKKAMREKWWLCPITLAAVFTCVTIVVPIITRKSNEQLSQKLEEYVVQYLEECDEEYFGEQDENRVYQVECLLTVIEQPKFSIYEPDLVEPGSVNCTVDIIVDDPDLYPNLGHGSISFDGTGVSGPSGYRVDMNRISYFIEIGNYVFADLYNEIELGDVIYLGGDGARYTVKEEIEMLPTNSGSSNKKCSRCNGTGSVRYNYGSSDLEAYLDGYDPYTYGQCGSCGGTGIAR